MAAGGLPNLPEGTGTVMALGEGDADSRPRPRPFRFLVVEGNNGVGKSECAQGLTATLGATLHHYPAEFVAFREAVALDTALGPRARLAYYLAATMQLSDLVRDELCGGHVVCDRYLAAPLSLLIAERSLSEIEARSLAAPWERFLERPDLTLLVRAGHEVACERIRRRAGSDEARSVVERRVLSSADFFAERESLLRREALRMGRVVELDTSGLSVERSRAAAWELVSAKLGVSTGGPDR